MAVDIFHCLYLAHYVSRCPWSVNLGLYMNISFCFLGTFLLEEMHCARCRSASPPWGRKHPVTFLAERRGVELLLYLPLRIPASVRFHLYLTEFSIRAHREVLRGRPVRSNLRYPIFQTQAPLSFSLVLGRMFFFVLKNKGESKTNRSLYCFRVEQNVD